ncbi:hypothetical protein RB597_006983 [Gaeumannomyces tritici]
MVKTTEDAPATTGPQDDDDGQPAPDYDDALDSIVDWSINRKDSTVTLTTRRATDDARREVPEEWVQRVNEDKVVAYWASFGRARENTIKCATYRVFRILGHRPGKAPGLLIHWVGYRGDPRDGSASWEPLDVIMRSSEALVLEYLAANGLTRQLTPKKRGAGATAAAAAAAAAAAGGGDNNGATTTTTTTPARGRRARTSSASAPDDRTAAATTTTATPAATSKKRRANSEAPPAKRARKSDGSGANDVNRPPAAKTPAKRGRPSLKSKAPAAAATSVSPSSSKSSPIAAPSRRPRAPPAAAVAAGAMQQGDVLFRLDLNISGVLHKDVQKLLELATELTAQGRSVSLNTQITPL